MIKIIIMTLLTALRNHFKLILLLPLIGLLLACSRPSITVHTELGEVEGYSQNGDHYFLGIPYAKPPVAENRWQPPQPVEPWQGVKKALGFKPGCPQGSKVTGVFVASEDCLYLNITRPAAESVGLRPVMVWLHGGSFEIGAGSEHQYNPTNLAKRSDVIVVTINYRMGVFGFFSLPELSAESSYGGSGNYFLMDQAMALRWVHDNIESFGGDPNNVTLFGESAGGSSTCLNLTSPLSKGLFQRAIIQSGACTQATTSLPEAEQDGVAIADMVGCTEDRLNCLRSKSAAELRQLIDAAAGQSSPFGDTVNKHSLVLDNYVFIDEPMAMLESGFQADVPVIIGVNQNEGSLFSGDEFPQNEAEYMAYLAAEFPGNAQAVAALYPLSHYSKPANAVADIVGDRWFICPAKKSAQAMVTGGQDVYFYYFTSSVQGPLKTLIKFMNGPSGPDAGIYHSSEIPFVFGINSFLGFLSEDGVTISHQMMQQWKALALNGNPNTEGVPYWPQFNLATEDYLEINTPVYTGTYFMKEKCDYWASVE